MTPKEYFLILKSYFKNEADKQKQILEAIRIQTFHLANLRPHTTYNSFKKNFPFAWDSLKKEEGEIQLTMDPDTSKSIQEQWDDIQKKNIISSKVTDPKQIQGG